MSSRWRYRGTSVLGTAAFAAGAVAAANHPLVQGAFGRIPYLGRPAPAVLTSGELAIALATAVAVVLGATWPLFKPRPRRILDTVLLAEKRILLAMFGLASLGYFNYSYRLPRSTLMLMTGVLLVALPGWYVAIRRRPQDASRAVLVGDDPAGMEAVLEATDVPVMGYVSPAATDADGDRGPAYTDGGVTRTRRRGDAAAVERGERLADLENLGGLSRLRSVLVAEDIDTALLAFARPDRAEFFGILDCCYANGVTAMVHRDHADTVLTRRIGDGPLVEIDLEPWDLQERVVKRAFDVAFGAVGLVALSPVAALIAVAIKLESPGPVLYGQERTAEFGETFTIHKFRSMVPEAEAETGAVVSAEDAGGRDSRVTRVGRFLRRTHLDEIPQLWSILKGNMSVVGPRPERPELDADIQRAVDAWRRRWFVRPGLTGLAQIRGATGHEPERKLEYDVEYVRRQSFWFDLRIVIRQLWLVLGDAVDAVLGDGDPPA